MNYRSLVFIIGIIALLSSCIKNDGVDEPLYSAGKEQATIDEYIAFLTDEDYDVDTTESGLFYVILEEGEGEFAKEGDEVGIKYLGYFVDGQVFDGSTYHDDGDYFQNGIYYYQHRVDSHIDGWDDGVDLLNLGAKALLFVPSDLAYGIYGYGSIPPYTPLVFEIQLMNLNGVAATTTED